MAVDDGLITPGNIDLSNRPRVKNPDGSISTIRSIGVNIDGKEVLIPTVVNGRVVSNADAITEYKKTGKHLGMFDSADHASQFGQQLHNAEAQKLAVDPSQGPAAGWTWTDTPQSSGDFVSAIGQPLATAAHPLTEDEPTGIDAAVKSEAFQNAAHPQTLSDFGHLLMAPTDATRGAIANLPTVVKAAQDVAAPLVSSLKEHAGNLLMNAAHPAETLDRIAKHLIGSDSPDPMELDAAKNELAAMRLKLQTARSVARQADIAKKIPVSSDLQSDARSMVDALHKATAKSGLLDASGKPLTPASELGDFNTKFVQSLKDRVSNGGKLSGAQYQLLQRIYKTVFP